MRNINVTEKEINVQSAPAILYVDDEAKSVKYFRMAFEREFPILSALSAAEAKAVLDVQGDHIGVLVSDQRMPVETGTQLLGSVKNRYPHIVRLLTTAYADLDAAVDAVNRGEIYRYILKPWNIEQLRIELHGAMELHRQKQHEHDLLHARRSTMLNLAAHIAHELRTPLASVRAAMHGLKEFLPELTKAYRRESERGDRPPEIALRHLATLENAPDEVGLVVDRANSLINMVLMNAREDLNERAKYSVFSILTCVKEAMRQYPFLEGERMQVRVVGEDFHVWGSELLFSYVVYNLIKNALVALRTAGRGEIIIRLSSGERSNRLYFRDTGTGVGRAELPHIFEEFYTGKGLGSGTGMGLPFCRRVLTGFGGAIECRSREGEYTEFEMTFPPVESGGKQNPSREIQGAVVK